MKRFELWVLIAILSISAASAQAADTKQTKVFGQRIEYLEAGSGPVVILLHGLGANKEMWRFTIPALASRFHVYAPDQIGFGASDKPLIDYRVMTHVDFLGEFMRVLAIPRATLVGNSMGGWTAANFAAAHPDSVDKLVLEDAAGYIRGPVKRDSLAFLNPATLEAAREALNRVFFNKQLISDAVVRDFFEKRLAAGDSYSIARFSDSAARSEDAFNDRLGFIKAPTLVIWGREDSLLPVADADAIAAAIPGARKMILERCGHVPHLECAVPFNKALSEFLETPAPAR